MKGYYSLLQPLLERGPSLYFVYDTTARLVVYVGGAYEAMTGDPVAHVNDDLPHWLQRLHPDDRAYLRRQVQEARPGEVMPAVELRVTLPGDGLQWLALTLCKVLGGPDNRPFLSGHVLDITVAKQHALNSEKFNTKKNTVLEILSHDLAAPLALLQQLTEQLRHDLPRPTAEPVERVLELMERTCVQNVNLIRDFVDNEFLESSSVVLKRELVDLTTWLGHIMEEYERSEYHLHVQLESALPSEALYVNVDVNKFQQVITNLISNSLKFTPDGGRIRVRLTRQEAAAVVTVADTGVGIPEHLQPSLFDKFTPARRPGLRGERTVGLGMSIIRTLVQLHEGRIDFTSTEGQGSTFSVEVPLA